MRMRKMSDPVTKTEVLEFIEESLADVEGSIWDHPDETVEAYEEGAKAHRRKMKNFREPKWSKQLGLSNPEINLIHRFLFATSFTSAWWHLAGDKPRRDHAAQTACLLVGGTGVSLDDSMWCLVRYERAWRRTLKSKDIQFSSLA